MSIETLVYPRAVSKIAKERAAQIAMEKQRSAYQPNGPQYRAYEDLTNVVERKEEFDTHKFCQYAPHETSFTTKIPRYFHFSSRPRRPKPQSPVRRQTKPHTVHSCSSSFDKQTFNLQVRKIKSDDRSRYEEQIGPVCGHKSSQCNDLSIISSEGSSIANSRTSDLEFVPEERLKQTNTKCRNEKYNGNQFSELKMSTNPERNQQIEGGNWLFPKTETYSPTENCPNNRNYEHNRPNRGEITSEIGKPPRSFLDDSIEVGFETKPYEQMIRTNQNNIDAHPESSYQDHSCHIEPYRPWLRRHKRVRISNQPVLLKTPSQSPRTKPTVSQLLSAKFNRRSILRVKDSNHSITSTCSETSFNDDDVSDVPSAGKNGLSQVSSSIFGKSSAEEISLNSRHTTASRENMRNQKSRNKTKELPRNVCSDSKVSLMSKSRENVRDKSAIRTRYSDTAMNYASRGQRGQRTESSSSLPSNASIHRKSGIPLLKTFVLSREISRSLPAPKETTKHEIVKVVKKKAITGPIQISAQGAIKSKTRSPLEKLSATCLGSESVTTNQLHVNKPSLDNRKKVLSKEQIAVRSLEHLTKKSSNQSMELENSEPAHTLQIENSAVSIESNDFQSASDEPRAEASSENIETNVEDLNATAEPVRNTLTETLNEVKVNSSTKRRPRIVRRLPKRPVSDRAINGVSIVLNWINKNLIAPGHLTPRADNECSAEMELIFSNIRGWNEAVYVNESDYDNVVDDRRPSESDLEVTPEGDPDETIPKVSSTGSVDKKKRASKSDLEVPPERGQDEETILKVPFPGIENGSVDERRILPDGEEKGAAQNENVVQRHNSVIIEIGGSNTTIIDVEDTLFTRRLTKKFEEALKLDDETFSARIKELLNELPLENLYVLEWLISRHIVKLENCEGFGKLLQIHPSVLTRLVQHREEFFSECY